ncbi:MAG: IS1595 family transposase [Rhodospirillaceae bacterium]|nr:IS1595 family transposase [Rhodospirillaceae bacterium]MYF85016.1 IS1595 family transposase [Rhodospirillaceae bacterium]MYH36190.1 IS1595 family transposase [Rhodospirillaceae bacterium]MYK16184.1 IS1595 family transposase [Rhodospirillaceae bacterium]
MSKAPGKSHREGISIMELTDLFPDEPSAVAWFEAIRWANGRFCGHCGSTETSEVPNAKPMPYWCKGCRSYFSVRTGTSIEKSRLKLRKWVFAIYLEATSLKGVSSMKLHRDLNVTQKTAWYMLHRIRESFALGSGPTFAGPVEADETFIGGVRKNMSKEKRRALKGAGTGHVGKTIVAGVRDRATNRVSAGIVPDTTGETLTAFVESRTEPDATVYTDEHSAYLGLRRPHEAVRHSAGEYVRDDAHTQGIESFWAMLKRAHKGVYHKISPKHLQRYVDQFAGKHNMRDDDTLDQMRAVVAGMEGKRLSYRQLIT